MSFVLALKLLLTPCMIAATSLVGRRWGPAVSGWLMGFPLTSGPVSVFLTLQYGPAFAGQAAVGTMAGQASVCIFCLVYSRTALRWRWQASAASGVLAFLLGTLVWNRFTLTLLPTFATVLMVIFVVARLIPKHAVPVSAVPLPNWDLPARMIVATVFVLLLTTFANALGPQLSGLIAPFPIFGTVLAVFAHKQQGGIAATQLLRGVVLGSVAFATFFLVVGGLLPDVPGVWTYLLATLAAIAVNGFSLRLAR
jgi:hypothetical protein